MNTTTAVSQTQREPELRGQTVVVMGGSSGIGLETARRRRDQLRATLRSGAWSDRPTSLRSPYTS
jgi:hypothetical protein